MCVHALRRRVETSASAGAISSAGLERLPYTQDVTGSNPVSPIFSKVFIIFYKKFIAAVEASFAFRDLEDCSPQY